MTKGDLFNAIRSGTTAGLELLPSTLLCDSIGSIGLKDPHTVQEDTSLHDCIALMKRCHVGSVLIVNKAGSLIGIFTERDCLMKVIGEVSDLRAAKVKDFMTPDPVCERPDASLAFALNLMSNGGFRHVPIVDSDAMPIGVVSIKDVVEYIVSKLLKAIRSVVDESEKV
jgi:CBS domain-containing protein